MKDEYLSVLKRTSFLIGNTLMFHSVAWEACSLHGKEKKITSSIKAVVQSARQTLMSPKCFHFNFLI